MIEKQYKLAILASLCLLMVTLPSFEVAGPTSGGLTEGSVLDLEGPSAAYDGYDPHQQLVPGSTNIGLVVNSSATILDNVPGNDWGVGATAITNTPWTFQLPGKQLNQAWDLDS